ncbi:MAG TPA: TIGR03087 family PEP-CTERM/XrtA system glycosyltransferase [Rhodanobacteraceae bacterium]|nr:TIGR03087 family PEP-CTERM/XrtA system glycosyltransferase [Rhodanobacteraceae bacterium]
MRSLLFLCHRLPWPPDKGDKIRSYHVLRRLAERHRVYLGTYVDDPQDWRYVPEVKAICAGTCIRPLPPRQVRRRALGALARREALTLGSYRDRIMQRWVDALVSSGRVDAALCYSSGVAPLVMHHVGLPRVMDFVDADSDKWQQYARARRSPLRMLYKREAHHLADFERAVATQFDASVFVSPAEAAFFCRRAPALAGKLHGIANGVDAMYWNPGRDYPDPYAAHERVVVFVGAMDYRANVHAVHWFVREVWPSIVARQPAARFYIVGSNPARSVRMLDERADITVTGQVQDVRPYLAHAHVVAAPLRVARGIQNKVLEALAMEKVVLATPEAWEGIGDFAGRKGCISAVPAVMAAEAVHWLDAAQAVRVPAARAMVLSDYGWAHSLDAYEAVLRRVQSEKTVLPALGTAVSGVCP